MEKMSRQRTLLGESHMLPTVRSWILSGETEGNMSYSISHGPTHQESAWVFTDAQCLSKTPMITWQSYTLA